MTGPPPKTCEDVTALPATLRIRWLGCAEHGHRQDDCRGRVARRAFVTADLTLPFLPSEALFAKAAFPTIALNKNNIVK